MGRAQGFRLCGLAALAAGMLRCESDHLTDFAGFSVPSPASVVQSACFRRAVPCRLPRPGPN